MAIVTSAAESVRTGPADWRTHLKSAIRDPQQLLQRLGLPDELLAGTGAPHRQFPTFVPEPFLARMVCGDPADPLLLQVLPVPDESREVDGFSRDAVGDSVAERAPGLIHKYHGRALLITRGACAVHCRYCFRRHYPYGDGPVSLEQFDRSLEVVRNDPSIEEIILSGGDPLMMVDESLRPLLGLLDAIGHLRRLRIHTRLPVMIPQRITPELVDLLGQSRLAPVVVLHVNHANEIDSGVRGAVRRLQPCGALLLNQSVLLRGVNDSVSALVELSRGLIEMNCLPYYLHQLDRVAGTAHFEVAEETGWHLVRQMSHRLPGYAVPRYVREVAGDLAKQPVDPPSQVVWPHGP